MDIKRNQTAPLANEQLGTARLLDQSETFFNLQPHEETVSHLLSGSERRSENSTHSLVSSSVGTCTQTLGHMTSNGNQYQEL
ncbi:hypothetical protein NHX12_007148 [Muraenolepis orangiensis]|uniref:Uncharacterized protein n=1 Tax=Muraenolepis orangiensis TaxID=630683 RepID=A0A9Q0IBN9_9TELE|nr:hypothetical protein NHX12_007148 [Muraenolepis orangiensis]